MTSLRNYYGQVIRVSLPLVVSMGATTVMEFTDRVFLGNYSLEALAAALPASITSFLFTAFFMGVSGYANVFIAQYTGARDHRGVGASLWQGIYFSISGAVCMGLLSFAAAPLFSLAGHAPGVQVLEIRYFRILCLGTGFMLAGSTLSCFFSGRGLTRPVMVIHITGTLFNIPLDYALINGLWLFPELGITGAGIATVASWALVAILLALLVFTKANNRQFHVWRARRFDPVLFARLMKYGLPGGVHFFLDILAFTFFILMVGRLGQHELAVTNAVISINSLAYMPVFGFSMGVSTLVGQAMGAKNVNGAIQAAFATLRIALFYVGSLALVFVLVPDPLIRLFISEDTPPDQAMDVMALGRHLLWFVSAYLLFDSLWAILVGVLKGAGDTAFVMKSMAIGCGLLLFLPVWVGIEFLGQGLYFAWACITLYLVIMSAVTWVRFRSNVWKTIRMIA